MFAHASPSVAEGLTGSAPDHWCQLPLGLGAQDSNARGNFTFSFLFFYKEFYEVYVTYDLKNY